MPIGSETLYRRLRALGSALVAANVLFLSHAAVSQENNFRREVLMAVETLATEPSTSNLYERLNVALPQLHSISECRTLADTRPDLSSATTNTNRVSLAFSSTEEADVYFLRPETIRTVANLYLRSESPIILVSHRGRLHVFDTTAVSEFTQPGVLSFHGFFPSISAIPSLVVSIGPVGSGNMMWFYRFDFTTDEDGELRITPNLLAYAAHVMDFQIDAERLEIAIYSLLDKWDSGSKMIEKVSLAPGSGN